jgi:hypothetical protein
LRPADAISLMAENFGKLASDGGSLPSRSRLFGKGWQASSHGLAREGPFLASRTRKTPRPPGREGAQFKKKSPKALLGRPWAFPRNAGSCDYAYVNDLMRVQSN